MDEDMGAPPRSGWAKLVPELLVEDIAISLPFWRDRLGFTIAYQRPEERFVYLERPEGAQIMLCSVAAGGRQQRWSARWDVASCSKCTSTISTR
jgi:hypothetical protein